MLIRLSNNAIDGIGTIALEEWQKHVSFILRRCGIDPEMYLSVMRHHRKGDYGGMKLLQADGYNCGPIACMVLWHTFLPNEVNTKLNVSMFRSKVVPKMKTLLKEAKESGHLLVRVREEVLLEQYNNSAGDTFEVGDDNEDGILSKHLIVKGRGEVVTIDTTDENNAIKDSQSKLDNDDEIMYISPNHRQKIVRRVESDMKRRKRQDKQGLSMKKRFKQGPEVKVGDTVNLKVDIRDRNSTIPRGILGIVAKLAPTGSGNCAIYCVHGLLGSKGKYTYYPPDQYSIVPKPTLDTDLTNIRALVLDNKFEISSNQHNIITIGKAHKLLYKTGEERVTRGKCQCGLSQKKNVTKKMKVVCGKNCGCI